MIGLGLGRSLILRMDEVRGGGGGVKNMLTPCKQNLNR